MGNVEASLCVERGQASAEELAALTAVLLALRGGQQAPEAEEAPRSSWWRESRGYKAPSSWQ
jgi:hypothetical protein